MGEGRNDYRPPADYKAPDFVQLWSDSTTRSSERTEQEREQRARDGQRDAEQRAQDGQRALEQRAQDAQRAAGQAARDAQRAAEQLARDEGRAATSTAARATYDLDRSGEGAQRGLAYSHGAVNEALLRRRAQQPTQAPSSGPKPSSTQAPAQPQAPASATAPSPSDRPQPAPPAAAHQPTPNTPTPNTPTPGVHPTPAVPRSRAAKGPAAKNAAHMGQPALGPGFAMGAGLAAVISAFLGFWIALVLALAAAAGPIKRGFSAGPKGIASSILAILLFVGAAGIQIQQWLPTSSDGGQSGSEQTGNEQTTGGLEGDAVETDPVPQFTLQSGTPVSGYGEASLDLVLPAGAEELAVLNIYDAVGDLTFSVSNPQTTVELQFGSGVPGESRQVLVNKEGAAALGLGRDPESVASSNLQIISGTEWEVSISTIDVLPAFETELDGAGPGLYLYTGGGGEAVVSSSEYGSLRVYTHSAVLDVIESDLPVNEARSWGPGPIVVEVAEASGIDDGPLPWSIRVTAV